MPRWNDYIKTKEYKSKTVQQKLEAKRQFFRDYVFNSDVFKKMPPEEQLTVQNEFLGTRREKEGTSLKQLYEETPFAKTLKKSDNSFRNWVEDATVEDLLKPFTIPENVNSHLPVGEPSEAFNQFLKNKVFYPETVDPNNKLKTYGFDFPRMVAGETLKGFSPSNLMDLAAFSGGMRLAGKVSPSIGGSIASLIPQGVKKTASPVWKFLNKNLTVGKGQPKAYQALKEAADLKKLAGMREADDVVKILTTTPEDMLIKEAKLGKATGKVKKIKAGGELPQAQQRYLGRLFRKEIDLGGKRPLAQTAEDTSRMFKEIEVNVGFNEKIQNGYKKIKEINKKLRSPKLKAQSQVGKVGEYGAAKLEKSTGIKETEVLTKTGKSFKKPRYTYDITQYGDDMSFGGEKLRSVKQVSKAKTWVKPTATERKALLAERKRISKEIQKEIQNIEIGVRSNYHIFDRKWTEQIRNHPKYKELDAIASKGRDIMDKWSKELIKSGIPSKEAEEVISENVGTYMARMYPKYTLVEATGEGYSKKAMRLKLDGLKHRKELSEKVLNTMIKEPALPVGIRVKEISGSVANESVFKAVASNPEWASKTPVKGWTKMADTKSLGSVRGLYVEPTIAADINATVQINEPGFMLTAYGKLLSAWKYGKVVLNPATHTRNMISNSILLDLSGVNHLQQARLYPKAFNALIHKNELYKMALEDGAIGGEFVGGEVAKVKEWYMKTPGSNIQKVLNLAKMPFKGAGKVYQGEEQAAKLVKYIHTLEKTGSRKLAAQEAQKWLFNYNKIPKFMEVVKQASPFATFTYKAIPRVAETLVKNPLKLYKYKAFFDGWNSASARMLDMSPQDYARSQKSLPPWVIRDLGGVPTNLLMPYRDKYGADQWLNLEYLLPLGLAPDLMDASSNIQSGENLVMNISRMAISNPFFTIPRDLSSNKDFKNSDIIPDGSTNGEAIKIATGYIYRQAFPSFMPGWKGIKGWEGGYSFSKLMDAIDQVPDYADRLRDLGPVMFDVFMGLKINPVDVNKAEMFKMLNKQKRIKEYQKQLYRLQHPAISEEDRYKEASKIFEKMQRVMEE